MFAFAHVEAEADGKEEAKRVPRPRGHPFDPLISLAGVLNCRALRMAAKPEKPAQSDETFETAMEKLEKLVATMEEEKLPLDRLLVSYEEGVRLANYCSEKLTEAEKRIEMITRNAAGEAGLEGFDSNSPAKAEPAKSAPTKRQGKSVPEDISLF
jgi:exodeoxyribonuclease VII small subunit